MSARIRFVSAGAGSGKTYRLTEILADELIANRVRPAGVIATTFTNKAAAELRERIWRRLLEARRFDLAIAIGEARIGTVNSVCGALVERFAFETGLATELTVLDEEPARTLVREAIDEVADGAKIARLDDIARRLAIEDWQAELQALVDLARANDVPVATLRGFGRENADALLAQLPKATRQDLTVKLRHAIAEALPELAAGSTKKTAEYRALVQSLSRNLAEGRTPWADWVKLANTEPEKKLLEVAKPLAEIAARYARHPRLHADLREYLESMFTLCAATLEVYEARKRELRAIDFTDQEHLLLRALALPAVEAPLREDLELLLVDEFQDTSPIQLALFGKLAALARQVYWVGDVKQAIYGFRGSDTALMEAVLSALPAMGGDTETLGRSFRSRPALVRLSNAVFVPAFAPALGAEAVRLTPAREERHEEPAFANWILGGCNKGEDLRALAAGIRRLVARGVRIEDPTTKALRPVRYADIAILVRSNETVSAAATALGSARIPAATGEPGLLETPEAVLALACLRRLNDPADTLATAEILSLADGAPAEDWITARLRYLDGGGDSARWRETGPDAHPILQRLAELRPRLERLAPREALEIVLTECRVTHRIVRWESDSSAAQRRLANLDALVALAHQYEDQCRNRQEAATVAGLLLWLGEQRTRALDALAATAVDAVQVLTHHGAKGLEWPVVILFDLHADLKDRLWGVSAESRGKVDLADPLRNRFIRYWPWPFGKLKKVDLADEIAAAPDAQRFRTAAIDENRRLLYVSMTRARDLLVLARSSRSPTGEWIDSLGAPWLMSAADATQLTLPDGTAIPCAHWILSPEDAPEPDDAGADETWWFRMPARVERRPPLLVTPSALSASAATVVERVRIGERIELGRRMDMAAVGNALHGCIAASLTDSAAPLDESEVGRILAAFRVADGISAPPVVRQIAALRAWIGARWPAAEAFAEVPVEAILPSGQVLAGRIDLLLRVGDGWVVLDHKSNPKGTRHWDEVALSYAGQLRGYAEAVERVSAVAVRETWVYFPVSGGAVRVGWT